MKTAAVLAVAVLANSFGNICLSKGMKQFGGAETLGVAWIFRAGFHVVSNPWMILGVFFLLVFLAAYLTALSGADLSFVLPSTAPAYLLTAGLSRIFLRETVSSSRWAGTLLIVAGTWLVTRTYATRASSLAVSRQDDAALEPLGPLRESGASSPGGMAGGSDS